ncbi:exosortase-associated EpsI family protein [Algisphaera agarilytica]|uniref:Methanolan biosynthesis EpsI domain-containing protein n=1 Tax=Algisphaera agarilytica TaxID=1385975 RepID=A0A7X0H8Y9_9BACT|nr:exosortase-associated EpsI family protein [Algisphaera agarilytica]MBB6431411.1 hypothetical protein [Algisphaera agarilytica]
MTKPSPTQPKWIRLLAPALASAMLVGMGIAYAGFPTAADAVPYHAKVLDLSENAPTAFGPWESRPIDVPAAAVQLLRPNAMLSREFGDHAGNRYASVLVVQCMDARDLSGHWPPNCYKAAGYTQIETVPRTWAPLTAEGSDIRGIEYTFDRETTEGLQRMVVANFLIVPGAGMVPDMASVRDAGADPQRRSLGAAQVQVVTDGSYTQAERDAIFAELLAPHWPLIQAIADDQTR